MKSFEEMLPGAVKHLRGADPVMAGLIERVGPCTLRPQPNPFEVLVRSIVAQLISTKAAQTISARVEEAVGPVGLNPRAVVGLGEERLRSLGLSRNKALALLDLAARAEDGRLPLDRLEAMSDADIQASLVEVRGIGPWTAEMFLIFCLGRLDVLPVGDLGLRSGFQDAYGMKSLPSARTLRLQARPWRPFATIATWYLWKSRGPVPQS